MSGLFTFLFLIVLAILFYGLIKPRSYQKVLGKHSKRSHIGMGFGLVALALLLIIGATTPKTIQSTNTNSKSLVTTQAKSTKPVISTKTITSTQPIAFTTITEQDPSLAKGSTSIKTHGVNGVETQTYTVTYSNGKETSRKLVSSVATTPPITEVVEQGTYVAPAPKPAPTPQPQTSCTPLTNAGNCYKAGEYCRNSDHGVTGIAGNGEPIICAYNNGWRWEPN